MSSQYLAQPVAGGQIRGVVTDPTGADIAGAQVTAEQTGSRYKRTRNCTFGVILAANDPRIHQFSMKDTF
jgi:hypothetical protein